MLGRPPTVPAPSRGPQGLRWALAGGAVVAVTAGLLAAPRFGADEKGSGPLVAPASSSSATSPVLPTASPSAAVAVSEAARKLGEKCVADVKQMGSRPPSEAEGSFAAAQLATMRVVMGERRGTFDVVVLGNAAGYDLECTYAVGGDEPTAKGGRAPLVAPSPTSVSLGAAAISTVSTVEGREVEDGVAALYGRVGSNVVGVSVATPQGKVAAAVSNGWFATAWPDPAPAPFEKVTVTLTLADGTEVGPTAYEDLPHRDAPDAQDIPN